jgi:hypothetical protein
MNAIPYEHIYHDNNLFYNNPNNSYNIDRTLINKNKKAKI